MCNTFAFHWFKKSLSWMWWEKLIIVVSCLWRVFQRKLTCIGWTQPSFWSLTEDKYVLCKLIIIYYIYMHVCVSVYVFEIQKITVIICTYFCFIQKFYMHQANEPLFWSLTEDDYAWFFKIYMCIQINGMNPDTKLYANLAMLVNVLMTLLWKLNFL